MTKGKSQIGINRLIKPHSRGRFICSRCISPLEFSVLLSFSFKTIANSNRQIRRPCADSVNKFVRLISLINSYLAFSFFSFFYDNVFAIRCIQIMQSFLEVDLCLKVNLPICIFFARSPKFPFLRSLWFNKNLFLQYKYLLLNAVFDWKA